MSGPRGTVKVAALAKFTRSAERKKNVGAAWLIPDRDRAVRITIIPKHGSDHLIVADQPARRVPHKETRWTKVQTPFMSEPVVQSHDLLYAWPDRRYAHADQPQVT